ncbi:MAG: alpha/beta fold hydrolase [Crocinitomicaceae bacterium]
MKTFALILSILLLTPGKAFVEEQVELVTPGCTLKGTLTTQDDPSQSTLLVILIAGSGPTDRNGNNPAMENNSLKMFSEMLVANGYSCLRYDKRAIGESSVPNLTKETLNFDLSISDASEWVNQYAADVRFHGIVLAGHSQGSLVALAAANQNENVSAVISLAGAGQPIHQILKWQLAKSLSPELQGLVNTKLDTLAMGDTLKVTPDVFYSFMHPSVQPFLISWMKYDPGQEAAKLKVPLLIVNGTTDLQVQVSEAKLLKEKQPNATLAIIKNMNHILKFTKDKEMGPQLELYGDPDPPLHKKLTGVVVDFLEGLNG